MAYLLTWTTYGPWLPGDDRGWTVWHGGRREGDPVLHLESLLRTSQASVRLTEAERVVVEDTIRRHCMVRGWALHAVNCRTNHCHAVLTARGVHPKTARNQLKAWTTRALKSRQEASGQLPVREHWWTEGGSQRYINREAGLIAAIQYVNEGQVKRNT